jgi:putative membrane protein
MLWVAGGIGLAIAVALLLHSGLPDILRLLDMAGWRLIWLVPLHVVPMACMGAAWAVLLNPADRPNLWYLTWAAIVRESVSGLLPVARVGGEVAGVRLLARRGVSSTTASASVIVELTMTMIAQLLFATTGLALLAGYPSIGTAGRLVAIGLLVSVVAIAGFVIVVRRWGSKVFALFLRVVQGLSGAEGEAAEPGSASAARFHAALNGMYRNRRALIECCLWQLFGFFTQALEVWVTLRILGNPVGARTSIVLESMAVAVQSAMFMVPAGVGTQEAGFLLFGSAVGLTPQVALALSLSRRVRQILLGVPGLISWYWTERRVRS